MWWECSECGACVDRKEAAGRCPECGRAALFVAADQVVAGVPDIGGLQELWLQEGSFGVMATQEERV